MTQPDGNVPNTERYERWLNEAASTFKNPERAKRQIKSFMAELRREDDEPEPAPVDTQYASEFIANAPKAEPLAINSIIAADLDGGEAWISDGKGNVYMVSSDPA